MTASVDLPSYRYVHERLRYDPKEGTLTWLWRPLHMFTRLWGWRTWNTRFAEKPAGSVSYDGYLVVTLNRIPQRAHRLCWLLYYGEPVPAMLDHIDGNKLNNKISNLRETTANQNSFNKRKGINNTVGVKGIRITKEGRYRATITINHKYIQIGNFATLTEAATARREAAEKLHGPFARHE